MIHLKTDEREYVLGWQNGKLRDKAGHEWRLDPWTGKLSSDRHGSFSEFSYRVVQLEDEK
jgi:hypothetical protein